jgi:hypothetical protein
VAAQLLTAPLPTAGCRLYVAEVGPVRLAQVVIDNTAFGRPRVVRFR